MRNTDKDKQKPRQRQKDRCTFLSFELIGKLLACSDSIRILGSERGLSWAVLVCNSFTMTHTQIRKKNKYTQRIPSCTNTQPYNHTKQTKQTYKHASTQTKTGTQIQSMYIVHTYTDKRTGSIRHDQFLDLPIFSSQ